MKKKTVPLTDRGHKQSLNLDIDIDIDIEENNNNSQIVSIKKSPHPLSSRKQVVVDLSEVDREFAEFIGSRRVLDKANQNTLKANSNNNNNKITTHIKIETNHQGTENDKTLKKQTSAELNEFNQLVRNAKDENEEEKKKKAQQYLKLQIQSVKQDIRLSEQQKQVKIQMLMHGGQGAIGKRVKDVMQKHKFRNERNIPHTSEQRFQQNMLVFKGLGTFVESKGLIQKMNHLNDSSMLSKHPLSKEIEKYNQQMNKTDEGSLRNEKDDYFFEESVAHSADVLQKAYNRLRQENKKGFRQHSAEDILVENLVKHLELTHVEAEFQRGISVDTDHDLQGNKFYDDLNWFLDSDNNSEMLAIMLARHVLLQQEHTNLKNQLDKRKPSISKTESEEKLQAFQTKAKKILQLIVKTSKNLFKKNLESQVQNIEFLRQQHRQKILITQQSNQSVNASKDQQDASKDKQNGSKSAFSPQKMTIATEQQGEVSGAASVSKLRQDFKKFHQNMKSGHTTAQQSMQNTKRLNIYQDDSNLDDDEIQEKPVNYYKGYSSINENKTLFESSSMSQSSKISITLQQDSDQRNKEKQTTENARQNKFQNSNQAQNNQINIQQPVLSRTQLCQSLKIQSCGLNFFKIMDKIIDPPENAPTLKDLYKQRRMLYKQEMTERFSNNQQNKQSHKQGLFQQSNSHLQQQQQQSTIPQMPRLTDKDESSPLRKSTIFLTVPNQNTNLTRKGSIRIQYDVPKMGSLTQIQQSYGLPNSIFFPNAKTFNKKFDDLIIQVDGQKEDFQKQKEQLIKEIEEIEFLKDKALLQLKTPRLESLRMMIDKTDNAFHNLRVNRTDKRLRGLAL